MQQINSLLNHLIDQFDNLNTTNESWFHEGSSLDDLLELESIVGYSLPESYKLLYQQFNGSTTGVAFGWLFIPLERTKNYYTNTAYAELENKAYIRPDNPDQVKPYFYSLKRIPIIEDYGGSVIYLDLDPNISGNIGQLILIFRDYPDVIYSVAPSLEVFIQLLIESVDNGCFEIIDEEYLEFDRKGKSSYAFWVELSNQWRTSQQVILPPVIDFFDKLPTGFIQEIISDNYDFVNQSFSVADTYKIRKLTIREDLFNDNWDFLDLSSNLTSVYVHIPVTMKMAEKLRKTTSLCLSAPTKNFEAISRLGLLRSLEINCQYIQSIVFLLELEKLQNLKLYNGQGHSLQPLQHLGDLSSLSLGNDYSSDQRSTWAHWEVLATMPHIRQLEVNNTNFQHLWLLKSLPSLRHISLVDCSITDYKSLLEASDGLSFTSTFDFFEQAIEIALHKRFLFSTMVGEGTEQQREKWENYMDKMQS